MREKIWKVGDWGFRVKTIRDKKKERKKKNIVGISPGLKERDGEKATSLGLWSLNAKILHRALLLLIVSLQNTIKLPLSSLL